MNFSEACEKQNKLYRALDALIELENDKYRKAINDLRDDIAEIDQQIIEK